MASSCFERSWRSGYRQAIEIQDSLFSAYLEEIFFGKLQIETDGDFEFPPLFEMRLKSKERKVTWSNKTGHIS